MIHFTPTLGIKDTARNVNTFIKDNMQVFWDIFKPYMPYIAGLYLVDLLVTEFLMPTNAETGETTEFALGGLIAGYFYTCLAITWHRVVIHGADDYVAVNPFKPKKSELAFIGMGIALIIGFFLMSVLFGVAVAIISPVLIILMIPIMAIAWYFWMKCMFYFPSKATGNSITLKQSISMTKGYVWKLFAAYIVAALKLTLLVLLYAIGGAMILGLLFIAVTSLPSPLSSVLVVVLGLGYTLPLILFFQPIFAIIWVTVLSNYYQYVLQNGAQDTND